MIRYFLAASVALFSFNSNAQIVKGTKLLGGSFGISNSSIEYEYSFFGWNTETRDNSKFSVMPQFGYFFKNNLAAGISVNFGREKSAESFIYASSPDLNKSDRTEKVSFGGGVFLRKYWNLNERVLLFGNLNVSYNYFDGKSIFVNTINSQNYDINGEEAGSSISPGITWLATNKIGLEISYGGIYYLYSKSQISGVNSTTKTNNYGANFDLSTLRLGVNFYL